MGILQALEDGGVLAVHREQLGAMLGSSFGDQMTAGDQAFLVGQGHIMPVFQSSQGCTQACNAHHCIEHNVRAFHFSQLHNALCTAQKFGCAGYTAQAGSQLVTGIRICNRHIGRVELFDLLEQQVHIGIRRQSIHLIALGTSHIQALGTDGTGGAQQSKFFSHFLFLVTSKTLW